MPNIIEPETDIWTCKIGESFAKPLPMGSDAPMRIALEKAYVELTGTRPDFFFSGWGGLLTPAEREIFVYNDVNKANIIQHQINKLSDAGMLNALVDQVLKDRLLGIR